MAGTLWLVPGHLGDPEDLTLRAVQLLGSAGLMLVEGGSDKALAAIARRLSLTLPTRRGSLDPSPETVQQVLRTLDAGEDVVFFGAEEGIPCFMDPGLPLLLALREARPDLVVRSVGGASVLGAALMRLERSADSFLFLGSVQQVDERDVERIASALRWAAHDRATLVLFTNGRAAKALQMGVADRCEPVLADVAWLVSLTTDHEAVLSSTFGPGHRAPPPVADDAPLVLVATARFDPDAPRPRWFGLTERWWRGAFTLRI